MQKTNHKQVIRDTTRSIEKLIDHKIQYSAYRKLDQLNPSPVSEILRVSMNSIIETVYK